MIDTKKTLYIIGNGFDIYHGIKSKYADFRDFIERENPDLLEDMEHYYNVTKESELWSDFESGLAKFNPEELMYNFWDYAPNYGSDEFREADRYDFEYYIENELEPIKFQIDDALYQWIVSLDIPLYKRLLIDKDTLFLTFNYSTGALTF